MRCRGGGGSPGRCGRLTLPITPTYLGRVWRPDAGVIQAQGFGLSVPEQSMRNSVPPPVMTIVGSASRFSHDQFDKLARQPGITELTLAPEGLHNGTEADEMGQVGRALDAALS